MKKHYYKKDIVELCDKKHLTVEEIFELVSDKYPEAGKSSIYRNVEDLANSGELNKLTGIGKKAYFEKNNGKHIHLIDKKTGKIIDLDVSINIPGLPKGFKIDDMDIKLFGEFIN